MILYFDTSAFVKLYAEEQGSAAMRAASKTATIRATSMITYAEMRSALARKRRFGDLTAQELERHRVEFERDWLGFERHPIDERTVRLAGDLAETYGFKGFDAVQLASAELFRRTLGTTTFACFDTELSRAASVCGMTLLSLD